MIIQQGKTEKRELKGRLAQLKALLPEIAKDRLARVFDLFGDGLRIRLDTHGFWTIPDRTSGKRN